MERRWVFPRRVHAVRVLLCLMAACRHPTPTSETPEACQAPEQLAATADRLGVKEGRKANSRAARMYEQALVQAERGRLGLPADPRKKECVPPSIPVLIVFSGDPEDLKAAGLMYPSKVRGMDGEGRMQGGHIDPLLLGELVRIEHVRGVHLFGEAIPQQQSAQAD